MLKIYTRGNLNPFNTRARKLFPTTIKLAFDWALWFESHVPAISTCISKVVRYFASSITVVSNEDPNKTDADRVRTALELLDSGYHTLLLIIRVGLLLAKMGNVFVSALQIFNRTVCCPQCPFTAAITAMRNGVDYQWLQGHIKGVCPKCGKPVIFNMVDKPCRDLNGRAYRFIIRSPRDMQVSYNLLTDSYKYLYKLPLHVKKGIISGLTVYIENTPKLYILAAYKDGMILFPPDKFFHKRLKCLSSMDKLYKGWGAPLFLSSFDDLLNMAYLDRFNQVVAADYIAPIRMISPPAENLKAGSDPNRATTLNGYAMKNFIMDAIRGIRDNQTQWITSPIPLNYQMIGGLAKQMAPVLLMLWYQNRFMLNISIPVLLRQTSFQAVAQTMGLRMFLRQWIHYFADLDDYLKWKAGIVFQAHALLNFSVKLNKTSFVLNDMNRQMYVNLVGGGLVSKDTALKAIGLDFKDLNHKMSLEAKYERLMAQEEENAAQAVEMTGSVLPPPGSVGVGAAQANIDAMQQQAAQGAPPPQGAPMPPPPSGAGMPAMPFNQGNSQSASLQQLYSTALQKADLIMQIGQVQGQGARISALRQLGAMDPQLHAQVKEIIRSRLSQIGSQAIQQSRMPQ